MKSRINTMLAFALCMTISRSSFGQIVRKDLITGFYQDQVKMDEQLNKCLNDKIWGNCVTIATIKAAIATFRSVPNIYKDYRWVNDTLRITFNDGLNIKLSRKDTADARQNFGVLQGTHGWIHRDSAIIVYASICMRAFIKKDELQGGECVNSYQDTFGLINSGFTTSKAGDLLGLKLIPIKIKYLKQTPSAIINSSAHAAFCTYGFQDIMGKEHKIRFNWMKNPAGLGFFISDAYILQK